MFRYNERISSQSFEVTYSLTLSQHTSRFSLPFDLKLLEILSPSEYLEKYVRVYHRRNILYKRIFEKYRDNSGDLDVQNLIDALSETYMDTVNRQLISQAIDLFDLPMNTKISWIQFRGMAAFSERYFFNIFKQPKETNAQLRKEIVEILDFSSLKRKLSGINISPKLKQILQSI